MQDAIGNDGLERRKGKYRRTQGERRFGWVRVSKWSSVNILELNNEGYVFEVES
ncbi:MAG: hypothetical protein ACXAB7_23605 [Candidatus Kariarchaeaceae archaeon]